MYVFYARVYTNRAYVGMLYNIYKCTHICMHTCASTCINCNDLHVDPVCTISKIDLYRTDFRRLDNGNWLNCKVRTNLHSQKAYNMLQCNIQLMEAYMGLPIEQCKQVCVMIMSGLHSLQYPLEWN